MNNHDILAYTVAGELVNQINNGLPPWSSVFSANAYATSSRVWPLPDFVVADASQNWYIAGEFKPPNQTKREYLTGLGQALAYTNDFHYSLLVVPETADDGYQIADHIKMVLDQQELSSVPLGLLSYNGKTFSPANSTVTLLRELTQRLGTPSHSPAVAESFYAKWREASPSEIGLFLGLLYEEGRNHNATGTIRDRAFDRLWNEIIAGRTQHWGGGFRRVKDSQSNKVGWGKNYRNFVSHVGWSLPDGKLTDEGFQANRLVYQYGADSKIFEDFMALSLLNTGKHLVLINAINTFQDSRYQSQGAFDNEEGWLDELEIHLESKGLLKRNPERHKAAVQQSERQFLKAEKQLWKNLNLIVARGPSQGRVFQHGRGFIFNWPRITSLLTQTY